jgi:ATP/maltotriose-dependent transcriptional regulator MalT
MSVAAYRDERHQREHLNPEAEARTDRADRSQPGACGFLLKDCGPELLSQVPVTVARGRTNAEIADELHVSLSTVKTHLASLMQKIGARNSVEIAMWAYETGRMKS